MPRQPEHCGCCGEYKKECGCPNGPTDSYRYALLRWLRQQCSQCPKFTDAELADIRHELSMVG